MDLKKLRKEIDAVDAEIVKLFEKRMEISEHIAAYKQKAGIPVRDEAREKEKILDVLGKTKDDLKEYTPLLFQVLFEMSRSYQARLNAQMQSFTELTSLNEDADLAELAIRLKSAELTYDASLASTGKMLSTTLLNYL